VRGKARDVILASIGVDDGDDFFVKVDPLFVIGAEDVVFLIPRIEEGANVARLGK